MDFTKATILITGGNSGIGRGLAIALSERGAKVIVTGRNEASLNETLKDNPALSGYQLDVTDKDGLNEFAASVVKDHPDLNVVIHNAGIMERENVLADVYDVDVAERTITTNLLAPIWRISLNRAYRVTETRPWYVTRLASLGYVILAVVIFAVISILLLAVPVASRFAQTRFPWLISDLNAAANWGLVGTAFLLMIGLLGSHKYLPAGDRRLIDIMPGVALTVLLWTCFGFGFAAYLSTFANYAATYAGLASIMIVLIFLYMVGVIFMLGAEFNAALMKYRIYSVFSRVRKERRRRGDASALALKAEEAANVERAETRVAQGRKPG